MLRPKRGTETTPLVTTVYEIPKEATRRTVGHIASQAYRVFRGCNFTDRSIGDGYLIGNVVTSRDGSVEQVSMGVHPPPKYNTGTLFPLYPVTFMASSNGTTIGGSVMPQTSRYEKSLDEGAPGREWPELHVASSYSKNALGDLAVAFTIARGVSACIGEYDIDIGDLQALTRFWKMTYMTTLMDQEPGTEPRLLAGTPPYKLPLGELLPDVPPSFEYMVNRQAPNTSASQ